jgi:glutamate racemase
MNPPRVLVFDSGMGGLTVARAISQQMPDAKLIYAADTAAFPYGAWSEDRLLTRIVSVLGKLIALAQPDICVVACNTASTIALAALRETYAIPFVGTVPAIKPAAAQTRSGIIGVLATTGTVKREYTRELIRTFAGDCEVVLHGATGLAELVERKLAGESVGLDALRAEIMPVFKQDGGRRTDIVVLGCTHYPLVADEIAEVSPWPVTLIDPSAAIARRVGDVADETGRVDPSPDAPLHGTVIMTASVPDGSRAESVYAGLGFPHVVVLDFPAHRDAL